MWYTKEILLVKKEISKDEWNKFIYTVSNMLGYLKKWKIIMVNEHNKIRYFYIGKRDLPSIINDNDAFMLKSVNSISIKNNIFKRIILSVYNESFIDMLNRYEIRCKGIIDSVVIEFMKIKDSYIKNNIIVNVFKNNRYTSYKLLLGVPSVILSNNFNSNKIISCNSIPKYFDISKVLNKLSSDEVDSLFKVDTFPYLQGNYYLKQNNYNYDMHSLILGSSGTGKSKLIASLTKNIDDDKKVIIIDPHASLKDDIGGIAKVIDFKDNDSSINLFSNNDDLIASTEIMISNLKNLFGESYNLKLERVLRYSINLLLSLKLFNFINLRKVLCDIEYRNNLLKSNKNINNSVIDFFLNDFSDLKTKSYSEAISPIITFLDELSLIPVFNDDSISNDLNNLLEDNNIVLFSLDRMKLGDKITKVISNLISGEVFNLMSSRKVSEHIIFIIDEIALLENPIIPKLLSEARKYNLSLILSGQYLDQVSDDLKHSIFANIINYYIFRVSNMDANILCHNFNMKLLPNNDIDTRIKYLTELQTQECVIRINSNGVLLPAFKAKTNKFISVPSEKKVENKDSVNCDNVINKGFKFNINNNISLKDILMSTKRG